MHTGFKANLKFISFLIIATMTAALVGTLSGQFYSKWKAKQAQVRALAENPLSNLEDGDIIANYSFNTLDGVQRKLYNELQYDKGMILIFSSSCGYSAREIDKLENQIAEFPADVKIIAISREPVDELTEFMKDRQVTFQVLADPTGDFFQQYDLRGTPIVILVDENKEVAGIYFGFDPEREVGDYLKTLTMN